MLHLVTIETLPEPPVEQKEPVEQPDPFLPRPQITEDIRFGYAAMTGRIAHVGRAIQGPSCTFKGLDLGIQALEQLLHDGPALLEAMRALRGERAE